MGTACRTETAFSIGRGTVPGDVGNALDLDVARLGAGTRIAMTGLLAALGAVAFRYLPADVVGAAVMVAKIAPGEIEETRDDQPKNNSAVELHRNGGKARAEKLAPEERSALARKAASTRWQRT